MNILVLVFSLEYGGAEKQVVIDANNLVKNGHTVTVAYAKKGELLYKLNPSVNLIKLYNLNKIIASFHLLFVLLRDRFDVIHAHMFWAEVISALPALLSGHKIIFNEHGLGLWRKWYHRLIMRIISLISFKIICSCELNKKIRIEKENLDEHKLIRVYNSFEITSNNDYKKKSIFKNDGNFVIGYVGRVHPIKRLNIFIEIAQRLSEKGKRFKIVIVGDGDELVKLKQKIHHLNLDKFFDFAGYVENVSDYYNLFDIFVLPSRIEAFSLALLEAGAHGLPCIAFDVGGNSEIIQNSKTGFIISDNDISDMINKIEWLMGNEELRKKMGINAKKFVRENFSTKKRIDNLERIYKNVC